MVHAGLDPWGGLCHLRWTDLGRTRRRHAEIGRIVPLSARDLWARSTWKARLVSLHLAAFVQRTDVDCDRCSRPCKLRFVLLARIATSICGSSLEFAGARPW